MFHIAAVFALLLFKCLTDSHQRMVSRRLNHRRQEELHVQAVMLLSEQQVCRMVRYARLNRTVPVLQVYFDAERDLRPDFRLTRHSMCGLLGILHREEDHGWGHHLEILIFVYWLAHGFSYRVAARAFSVPKSTVCRLVHKVAEEIRVKVLQGKVIFFPRQDQLDEIGQGFGRLARHPAFNKAVGAIDGCHVRIKPPKHNQADYFNYKQFFSIQMQAICDSTGRFLNVFVGYPGSVHDTRVFKNSKVYVDAEYPPQDYFLLGDGGYPCLETPITVITPYRLGVQARFNHCHSRARSVIERAFGMMKARWRATLFKALEVKVSFCTDVVVACAFLHNICLTHGDVLDPEPEPADAGLPPPPDQHQERSGAHIRETLAAQVSAPVNVPGHMVDHDYV